MDDVHRRSIIDATSTPSAKSYSAKRTIIDGDVLRSHSQGANPAETPIKLVAKFELVINLNAARVFWPDDRGGTCRSGRRGHPMRAPPVGLHSSEKRSSTTG